jgi:Tol biopolymer transport system component
MTARSMDLSSGARLGPYEITAPLGAGGMGDVYKARDTRLGRQVALKTLPVSFAVDPERLARFRREAQVLASLNHPHIAQIYGVEEAAGVHAIVMELVDGEDLAVRLARGPLPLEEALPIAQQTAAALEAAHDNNIVHRDLKPANIKLKPDGSVKVLDFGLAKALDPPSSTSADAMNSPTLTAGATGLGVLLGTAAYMAPEQARGRAVDKRADIWAFGCVLYEMLTGRPAFAGDDVSDVLASVLAREPGLDALPAEVPPAIRRLLERCLRKNAHERLRDIGDARIELEEALGGADGSPAAPAARRSVPARAVGIMSATLIALAAAVWMVAGRRAPAAAPEARVEISTPPATALTAASVAISPDGRRMAFVGSVDGQSLRLWVRELLSGDARSLAGTDGARHPFWSPDGRSVGFFADNTLKKIEIDSGSVQPLAYVYRGTGGAWNRDGVILFSSLGDPISRVSSEGGEPRELQGTFQQGSNFSPHFLPDGRRFLYYVRGTSDARGIYAGQLDGNLEVRRMIEADEDGVAITSGYVFFIRQRTLLAQRFDPVRLEPSAEPATVAACPCPGLSASDNGSIAYRLPSAAVERRFTWFDRSGTVLGTLHDSGVVSLPSLLKDDQRLVGYRGNPADGNVDLWLIDIGRGGNSNRLTLDPADDVAPVWSPTGDRIVFSSNRKRAHDIYMKQPSVTAPEELLLANAEEKSATDWSQDGSHVLFDSRGTRRRSDIWALPMAGQRTPFAVARTEFEEQRAQFSPDGKWVAYQSNESGRHEIYVQSFPIPGTKRSVSRNGGVQVRWARHGRELYYVGLDGQLMAVPFRVTPNSQEPELGMPEPLFTPPLGGTVQIADFRQQYVVAGDGRFLIATATEPTTTPIRLILNWTPSP